MIGHWCDAHSGRHPGAKTKNGTTEADLASQAGDVFCTQLRAGGHFAMRHAGALPQQAATQRKAFDYHQDQLQLSLSVHFHDTPNLPCVRCGTRTRLGESCWVCGQHAEGYLWGHYLQVPDDDPGSKALALAVNYRLQQLLEWSTHLGTWCRSDFQQHARRWYWLNHTSGPRCQVVIGYVQDPRIAHWIRHQVAQRAVGMQLALGALDWFQAMGGCQAD